MADRVPEVSDFEATADTPRCPKCGAPMDRGRLDLGTPAGFAYAPSVMQDQHQRVAIREAQSCIACGYLELYCDPVALRCVLAGVDPPE